MYTKAFIIDKENNTIEERTTNEDYERYVDFLLHNIKSSEKLTYYNEESKSTEVIGTCIDSIITMLNGNSFEQLEKNYRTIASRFLRNESEAQERVNRLSIQINTGCLVQAIIGTEHGFEYLIAKLDSLEYLESQNLVYEQGIEINEKKLGKSALIDFSVKAHEAGKASVDDVEIESIRILLDNDAKYFYKEFLEVTAKYSNEKSTETASLSTLKLIDNQLKREYSYDRRLLRNSFIHYMRSNDFIDFSSMVSDVFEKYFNDENCNIPQNVKDYFLEKVKELPEKKNFSKQFTRISSKISARVIKDTFKLGTNIDLEINDVDSDTINEKIHSGSDQTTGMTYVKIYTDDQYALNSFKSEDD